MNRKAKGFTLLELTLVLVIITAIILIAGRYYQQANEASKVTDAVSKTRKIIEASFEWVKAEKNFRTITIDELTNENLLSDDDIQSPWSNNDFKVVGTTDSQGNYSRIKITIPSVPPSSCLSLQDSLSQQNVDTTNFNCNSASATNQTAIYPDDED